ncbi:hypothetical protein V2J09_009252 [Rumex salicifolius]
MMKTTDSSRAVSELLIGTAIWFLKMSGRCGLRSSLDLSLASFSFSKLVPKTETTDSSRAVSELLIGTAIWFLKMSGRCGLRYEFYVISFFIHVYMR